jgi:hypothetical protein
MLRGYLSHLLFLFVVLPAHHIIRKVSVGELSQPQDLSAWRHTSVWALERGLSIVELALRAL